MNDIEERIRGAFEQYRFQAAREEVTSRFVLPSKQPTRRRPRSLLIAAAICATIALAVAMPSILPGAGIGGADPAAAATLSRAADAVRNEPWFGSLHDGQYLHFKMINTGLCGGVTAEWWLRQDGSGIGVNTPGRTYDLTPTTSLFNYWPYVNYPTDPKVLSARFAADPKYGGGVPDFMGTGNAATFAEISGLLSEFTAPPELRAALFEVMAGLDGVELMGTVKDPLGRPGTAVGYTYEGVRDELVFEPATAQLLATQSVLVDPQAAAAAGRTGGGGCSGEGRTLPTGPAGRVEYSTSFYAPVIVDSIPRA